MGMKQGWEQAEPWKGINLSPEPTVILPYGELQRVKAAQGPDAAYPGVLMI